VNYLPEEQNGMVDALSCEERRQDRPPGEDNTPDVSLALADVGVPTPTCNACKRNQKGEY